LGSRRRSDDFEVLEGDLHGLTDTAQFLRTLARLDEVADVRACDLAEVPQQRERLAAGGLFRWEVISRLCVEVTHPVIFQACIVVVMKVKVILKREYE